MKGKPIHIAPPQMIISSDAAKTGELHHREYPQGDLDAGREPIAHQHTGANRSRTGNQNFYKRERGLFDSRSDGQHSSLMLFNKNIISKRIWQYLLEREITLTAEWIPTHLNVTADSESRNVKDYQRMETKYQHFSSLRTAMGEPGNIPICLQNFTPSATIYKPKSRSTMYPSGCISKELGKINSLCVPPINWIILSRGLPSH